MFRPIRRSNQQISTAQCAQVLAQATRGVLAVQGEDGYPYALPMNHIYLDGNLYFHCAKVGHKMDAITANDKVSYCVMDAGYRKPEEWAFHVQSVVIFGRIQKIQDPKASMEIMRKLGLKHYPTPESVEKILQEEKMNFQILQLQIDHMTGKLVKEA